MEEKKVQNIDELNDKYLEQVSGGADNAGAQIQGTVCPKCGRSVGIVVLSGFKCPYCGYEEAEVFLL